jgi:hypothetical protein
MDGAFDLVWLEPNFLLSGQLPMVASLVEDIPIEMCV